MVQPKLNTAHRNVRGVIITKGQVGKRTSEDDGVKQRRFPMHESCFPILAAVARSLTAFKSELVKKLIKYNTLEVHASPVSRKIKSAPQENQHMVSTILY